MCRKKFTFKRKACILLLIGIFILSGCGQSDSPLTETVNTNFTETEEDGKIDTNCTETEDKVQTGDEAEDNEPSDGLPKPLEVPVNTKEKDIHYYIEDDIDPLRAMRRCQSDGENIYLVYGEPDLYVMPIGAEEHSRANIDNPEEMNVCNIAVDTYGRIHLLMSRNGDEWFIWRLDEGYQLEKEIDISAYFETKRTPGWFLIDKDGTYYLQWSINRDGIIVDSEGVLKHRFTPESLGTRWIYEAAVGKDGQLYLVHGDWDEKLEIGEFDVENCSIKKEDSPLCFSGSETFSAMSRGTDTNLLLFSPYSGVWACDPENGVLENRVPLSDIDFGGNTEFWPLTFLADGRLLLAGMDENGNQTRDDDFKYWLLKYLPAGK